MRKIIFLLVIFASLCTADISAQNIKTITGKVVDDKGVALSGVTISAGASGATTGPDGSYTIKIPASVKSITFSYVGFASVTRTVSAGAMDVTLSPEDKALSEVVVVGYGTQRKKEVTGSVSSINGSKIKDVPMQSFDQALSGRAAGVSITIPNGVVNNPPVIRVRGVNSISLSSFPLVVIDGVPSFTGSVGNTASNNPLGDLNPSDIESIDILKDAAATAIYGSRASAGVLLVTTKKGKGGRARVTYDGWVGFTKPYNLIPVLDATEFTTFKNEALVNAGTPANGTTRGFYTMTDAAGNLVNTDWYGQVFRTGLSQSHSVSVSGNNEKTNYFMSASTTTQEGMLRNNDFKRLTGRLNVDHKVTDFLTVGASLSYTKSINAAPNTGSIPGTAFNTSGLGRLPIVLPPNVGPYKNDGTYNINTATNTIGQGNNLTQLSFTNPIVTFDLDRFTSETDRIVGNGFLQLKLARGLNFKTSYGIDNLLVENQSFQNALHGDGVAGQGQAANTFQRLNRWVLQNLLTYDKSFSSGHSLSLLLGNEQQATSNTSWGAIRTVVADPFYNEFQGSYNNIVPTGNNIGENYFVSFFGRVNYDYKKKYLLSINGRRDGFSAFAPGRKYGNFYGGGIGWVVSDESFFSTSGLAHTITNLKLKASYGEVGNNQGLSDYPYYSAFSPALNGPSAALFFSQAGNRDLTWESSKKLDLGIEFSIARKFNFEISYFKNDVDNLILSEPQAPSRGIPGNSILRNVGSMVNKGLEFTFNATLISRPDFSWTTNFNISTLDNKVKSLAADNADIFPATGGLETPSIVRVGESIGSFFAIPSVGVNPANGQRMFRLIDGTIVQYNPAVAANVRWTKASDGTLSRAASQGTDGQIYGPALPKWQGGWDNTFRFRNFDIGVLLFYSGGNYVYNGTKAGLRDMRVWNNSKEVLTRWQKAGDVTNIPRPVFGDNISNGSGLVISENVEKGDFLKVRNISIGYSFPKNMLGKISVSSCRIYASVQNAFTFTKYTGFDPEISSNGNGNGNPSVDRNSVPMARTITFGLNVGF